MNQKSEPSTVTLIFNADVECLQFSLLYVEHPYQFHFSSQTLIHIKHVNAAKFANTQWASTHGFVLMTSNRNIFLMSSIIKIAESHRRGKAFPGPVRPLNWARWKHFRIKLNFFLFFQTLNSDWRRTKTFYAYLEK